MRISKFLRTIFLPFYICILVIFFLIHSFNENTESPDDWEDSDADLDDDLLIYGYPRKEIAQYVPAQTNEPKTTILMWSNTGIGPQHLGGCPEYNCEIIWDSERAKDSKAIVFFNGPYGEPPKRDPSQFYVFFTQESPVHMSVSEHRKRDFFNLTLGFRRDADIACPYGYVVKRKKALRRLPPNVTEIVKGKNRPVAWFVSNCGAPSGRSEYVEELQKYMDIDIYGACGNLNCPKGTDCNGLLERKYKFYLAFENSLCKDYSTEKFWEKMTLNIVTIVLKRSIISNQAPPDSFIAADDFKSPKELAEYLIKLDQNFDLYMKHFQWRLQYRAIFLNGMDHAILERPWCFCRLCLRLKENPIKPHVYSDVDDWWTTQAACDTKLVPKLLGGTQKPNKNGEIVEDRLVGPG